MTADKLLGALVVDDDPLVRQATARGLTQAGVICDVAADARQALERLGKQSFDVAIVDLRMPEINGHTLVLKMLEMDPRPAIVVLTGLPEPKLIKDLLGRGVEDFMAKPANYDLLALKAKALAARRRASLRESAGEKLLPSGDSSRRHGASTLFADGADGGASTDDRTALSEKVADQIKATSREMQSPPTEYDAFRIASGNSVRHQ